MIRVSNFPVSRRQSRSYPLLAAAAACVLGLSASAHASNIVADPGFEAATGGTYTTGQSIDGSWTVGGGSSTVFIDNQDPYVFNGNNSANLTGLNAFSPNSLSQNLSTIVGMTYNVSYWANSDSPNTFSLTANGNAVTGTPASIVDNGFPSPNWLGNSSEFVNYNGQFTATATVTDLMFTAEANPTIPELLAGDGSVVIDDVTVYTPEPGSIILMLTGILGLGLLIARKRLGQSVSSGSMLA